MPALIAKFKFGVKYYLITRDIFPQWLLQSGIIKNGALYKLLLFISRLSYLSASYIGLQSKTDKDIVTNYLKEQKFPKSWIIGVQLSHLNAGFEVLMHQRE